MNWPVAPADSRGDLPWSVSYMDLDPLPPTKEEWMKSHVLLMSRVLEDTGIRCCTSTTHDRETIVRRVEDEGLSFLTITLPTFGKDFERCLDQGRVDSSLFKAFAKKGKWLPAFLRGYTSQVFDEYSGALLDEPCVDSIQAVRQISYLFKRLKMACTPEREKAAFKQFIECDRQVTQWNLMYAGDRRINDFLDVSHTLFGDVFKTVDQQIADFEIIPNHGPGATADRLVANGKFDNRLWTTRLEEAGFYACDYLFPSVSHYLEHAESVTWLEPEAEMPVRVVSVPKTLKTPRIIAIEPTHKQYVQQGLKDALVQGIERDDILRDIVGFQDQTPNHDMACHGSRVGDLATLDLSEASDRVSNLLVMKMFAYHGNLKEAVSATRSVTADVPGYETWSLAKFASMGSALTFPVEAMVFTTLVFMGIGKGLKARVTPSMITRFRSSVRVYGDDIIVPVNFVRPVIDTLEAFGLKVNHNKSFWTGKFRESCGKDYYDGHDVSIVKVSRSIPTSRKQALEVKSTVDLRNHMYEHGYWRTAEFLDRCLEKVIPFPRIGPDSQGMGRYSVLGWEAQRECPYLQRPLVRAAVLVPTVPSSSLDGIGALLKFFIKRIDEPYETKHLERAGRPSVVNIKLRWVQPY